VGYNLPSDTDWVTSSWWDHANRNPPSSEPGTDYGSGYGSPLYAPGNGTIVDYSHSNANGTGRYLTIDLDDGRRTRSLHLSEIWVTSGRVSQGQQVGLTGASGFGSDWGYGAHVHQTLWDGWYYNFCSGGCTIDFAPFVGSAVPGPTQRQVLSTASANRRGDPSTQNPPIEPALAPNTIGNFDGWINGEVVSGNGTWFRGISGNWFWSGGFTDTGTHDLADLNPPAPTDPRQRVAVAEGANGRPDPSTGQPAINFLAGGSVANMTGWITGEDVGGNATWFQEANGTYYWSGGFTDTGTHDLTDLDTGTDPDPSATARTVSTNPANIRDLPFLDSPAHSSSPGGSVVDMDGYTHGDAVEGNDVWFRRKADADWMWSGGFTSAATDGLTAVPTPNPPLPTDPDNPRGLPVETGYQWPLAQVWLDAPLGHSDCEDPSSDYASRNLAGTLEVDGVIDTYVIHWTDTGTDDEAAANWHSYCNSRSSAPTTQINRDGRQTQFIRPGAKPAATGPDWNWRSFAVETVGGPDNFTPEQWEVHAQNIALLASLNGKHLDGVPVDFAIDRDHVLGHRECDGQSTECPGDAQIAYLDTLIARAIEIYEGDVTPPPDGDGVLDPEDYPELYASYLELSQAFGDEGGTRRARR
jgi:hypothetical protein